MLLVVGFKISNRYRGSICETASRKRAYLFQRLPLNLPVLLVKWQAVAISEGIFLNHGYNLPCKGTRSTPADVG